MGGSNPNISHYAEKEATIGLAKYRTNSNYNKYMYIAKENQNAKRFETQTRLTISTSMGVDPNMPKEEVFALGVLKEQTEGIFYDLLPRGTTVDFNSIKVRGESNNIACTYSIEIIENFRDTGRSLLIVRVEKAPGTVNYHYTGSYLYSGFILEFNILNTYVNLLDNPKSGQNYSAYESTVGPMGNGNADLPQTGFIEANAKTAFTNINGQEEMDSQRFMHGYASWSINPPQSAELGFDKTVKAPQDSAYSKETVAQGGGSYTYRLRLANRPETSAQNIIFYDSLEDRVPAGEPVFWQGRLEGFDLSQPRQTWGVAPVIYYATRVVDPLNIPGDRLLIDNTLNTALWTKLELGAPIPVDLKAVAIDLRYKTDGSVFVLPPERSLVVLMQMRAPGDVKPYIDPTYYAWNSAYLSAQTSKEGTVFPNAVVDVIPTKVSLRPVDLSVDKTSTPPSGTAQAPTIVFDGNELTYTLSVKNTNTAEAITDIVLEDEIPTGLAIDQARITQRFSASGPYAPLSATTRVVLTQTGQKLSFAIDKLAAGESVSFQIPLTVLTPQGPEPTMLENTAVITRAFSFDQEIKSPTTYHEVPLATVQLDAQKVLKAGGRVLQPGEFFVELTDTTPERNLTSGPHPNAGTSPSTFEITPLTYTKEGTYTYYLREVVPSAQEAGMEYASEIYYITVLVKYDSAALKLVPTLTMRLDSPSGALVSQPLTFTNTYKATGSFAPEIGKSVTNAATQDFYDGKFSATLTDEAGQTHTATNQNGVFRFEALSFDEAAIGQVFTYTIKEVPGSLDSILYDGRAITLKLKVNDLGQGQLGFEPEYWLGASTLLENATFINEFQSTSFEMKKIWSVPADTSLVLPNPLPPVTV